MREEIPLCFGPFRLEPHDNRVWRGAAAHKLTRKAFAVLRYLVDHPHRIVSKEELFHVIWPDVVVSDAALTVCMSELRYVLGDNAKTPVYIETVYGHGYRFIGKVVSAQPSGVGGSKEKQEKVNLAFSRSSTSILVGREAELARLQHFLNKALNNKRQIVFVTGEPGIGKTALINQFLAQCEAEGSVWCSRGQCIEQYGAGEPYMPVLEILSRIGRAPGRERLTALLAQYAPSWLVQTPAFLSVNDFEKLRHNAQGATQMRMLRELAEAMTVLTAEHPLVLVLEDLHWSDPSTVALLAYLARWPEPMRLLVLGSYRPADLLAQAHPLIAMQGELIGQGLGVELSLPLLTESAVEEYVQRRFAHTAWPTHLARTLYRRTEGNPLFMTALVEELLAQGVLSTNEEDEAAFLSIRTATGGVPERLRQLITMQMERLQVSEQRLLEAASVAGLEFSVAELAAILAVDDVTVEDHCERFVRHQQFLRPAGIIEWPDGTVAAQYGFVHALYQALWQERVGAERWRLWRYRLGERKEAAYGERTREIAAELAIHFEEGRDYQRAVQYRQLAGEEALYKSAYQEAARHFANGLACLKMLSNASMHVEQELSLQVSLGASLMATKGYAAPEVADSCRQVRALCQRARRTGQFFRALSHLRGVRFVQGRVKEAREIAEEQLLFAQQAQSSPLFVWAHYGLGETLLYAGEFVAAQSHLEQGTMAYDFHEMRAYDVPTVHDSGVACLTHTATVLWMLGHAEQALEKQEEAMRLARKLTHPFSLAWALSYAALHAQLRREAALAQEKAETLIDMAHNHGFPSWLARGEFVLGWALVNQQHEEAGLKLMQRGFANWRTTGTEMWRSYWVASLTEAYTMAGQGKEGYTTLAEFLTPVEKSQARWYDAELYRLKGELTLQLGTSSSPFQVPSPKPQVPREVVREAEAYFLKAIEIAQQQQAKLWGLRATISLARLRQQQATPSASRNTQHKTHTKLNAIRTMLAEVYHQFREGFNTKDLQEAKMLLDALHR